MKLDKTETKSEIKTKTKNKLSRNWFWLIFVLCTVLWSSIFTFFIGSAYYEVLKHREITDGHLQHIELISPPTFNFFMPFKWINVQYEYTVNGHKYQGSRATFLDYVKDVDDFENNLGQNLQQSYQNKQVIKVWYDSTEPNNAVLDNQINEKEFIDQFLWAIIPFWITCAVFSLKRPTVPVLSKSFPHLVNAASEDWSLNPELLTYYPSNVRLTNDGIPWVNNLWWSWNIPAIIIFYLLFDNYVSVYIWGIIPSLLLLSTIGMILESRPYTETALLMFAPGKIGAEFKGEVFIKTHYNEQADFSITLTCGHSYMSNEAGKTTRKYETVWKKKLEVKALPFGKDYIKLPFCFEVPNELPETTILINTTDDSYYWSICLDGTISTRIYPIPVIKVLHE